MPKLRDRIVRNVPDVPTPTIMRGQLIHSVIRQLNSNTIAINSPRQVNEDVSGDANALNYSNNKARGSRQENSSGDLVELDALVGTGVYVTHNELTRATSTVRVENPEDATQYVDVERIDRVLFLGTDGSVNELRFKNT